MYFMVFRYLQTGGVETLTLREGEWLKKHKGDVCVITQIITEDMLKLYSEINVKVIVLEEWSGKSIYKAISSMKCSIDLIHMYDLGDFLRFKSSYPKEDVKLIYYCVHPTSDCYFHSSSIAKKFLCPVFSKAISVFNKNKNIIYMDEDTLSAHLKHYGLEKESNLFSILPLPYKIKEHPLHKREENDFNILTVSRADFPYKGYVFGLVDKLNKNYEKFSDFKLTIISRGNGIEALKEKINSLDDKVKDRIQLIEGVSPDKLPDYYYKADVYIGMGTTLLEAASFGVPTIAAQYDTYNFASTGSFDENPMILGSKYNMGDNGFEIIKKIFLLSNSEYESMQKNTVKSLKENYDENLILERLDVWKCNNDRKLGLFSNLFLKLYFILRDKIFG